MVAIKVNDKIIHDEEVVFKVFLNALFELKNISKKLERDINNGYIIKDRLMLKDVEYNREIEMMENKLEILKKLFDIEKCKKYISTLEENTDKNKEYIMHNNMEVSNHFSNFLINNKKPLGTFYTIKDNKYVGINNLNGNALIEEFNTKKECLDWLNDTEIEEAWELEI